MWRENANEAGSYMAPSYSHVFFEASGYGTGGFDAILGLFEHCIILTEPLCKKYWTQTRFIPLVCTSWTHSWSLNSVGGWTACASHCSTWCTAVPSCPFLLILSLCVTVDWSVQSANAVFYTHCCVYSKQVICEISVLIFYLCFA